ncbi:hypothetical protein Btru_046030 [Bulinus truncatus]|nr:hypothetical protein Btru_046030 [Bulinus truncatus]
MEVLILTCILCLISTLNAFLQCPVCTERNNPASCIGSIDCDVNYDVCELTIYKKEQNRIEFKCSDKSTCSHEETQRPQTNVSFVVTIWEPVGNRRSWCFQTCFQPLQ